MPWPVEHIGIFTYLALSGAAFVPAWRILARVGLNPAWAFLLFLIPPALPLILAYGFWPAIDGRKFLPKVFD